MSTTENTTTSNTSSSSSPPPVIEAKKARVDDVESARLCNEWVESGITSNKSIMFLLQTLIDSGCHLPEKFIRCTQCVKPQAGGFGMVIEEEITTPTPTSDTSNNNNNNKQQCQRTINDIKEQFNRMNNGTSTLKLLPEIYICQQYMENEYMTHKTVHHELIHAIDMCRSNMDPIHNCIHLSCTEIRAENLSGECSFLKELPHILSKGQFKLHGQECVKRRAILSVRSNPNCNKRAEEYVTATLPRCFQDYYPYDKHPNQR